MTATGAAVSIFEDELVLADRCARREPEAVRDLLTANNQRLFRAAWSILKDRDEAEEAVQSAYLRAFAALGDFAGHSTLSTWLTRIAVNEALSRLRARQRQTTELEGKGVAILDKYRETLMTGSLTEAPDSQIARKQLRLMIEDAVAKLPDQFRTVFVLRDVEGLSTDETSNILAIPQATVKTRLHRARARMQEMLAPELGRTMAGAFPFAGVDCERLTERVMSLL